MAVSSPDSLFLLAARKVCDQLNYLDDIDALAIPPTIKKTLKSNFDDCGKIVDRPRTNCRITVSIAKRVMRRLLNYNEPIPRRMRYILQTNHRYLTLYLEYRFGRRDIHMILFHKEIGRCFSNLCYNCYVDYHPDIERNHDLVASHCVLRYSQRKRLLSDPHFFCWHCKTRPIFKWFGIADRRTCECPQAIAHSLNGCCDFCIQNVIVSV